MSTALLAAVLVAAGPPPLDEEDQRVMGIVEGNVADEVTAIAKVCNAPIVVQLDWDSWRKTFAPKQSETWRFGEHCVSSAHSLVVLCGGTFKDAVVQRVKRLVCRHDQAADPSQIAFSGTDLIVRYAYDTNKPVGVSTFLSEELLTLLSDHYPRERPEEHELLTKADERIEKMRTAAAGACGVETKVAVDWASFVAVHLDERSVADRKEALGALAGSCTGTLEALKEMCREGGAYKQTGQKTRSVRCAFADKAAPDPANKCGTVVSEDFESIEIACAPRQRYRDWASIARVLGKAAGLDDLEMRRAPAQPAKSGGATGADVGSPCSADSACASRTCVLGACAKERGKKGARCEKAYDCRSYGCGRDQTCK